MRRGVEMLWSGNINLSVPVWVADKESDDSIELEPFVDGSKLRHKIINRSYGIIRGQVQYVIRKVNVAKYEPDIDEVNQVLMSLYFADLVEKNAHNSYKLHDVT
tara:strand:- start:704 stop:1015 length:312 start_codon:yes stop_codon:yes gene_type:complete